MLPIPINKVIFLDIPVDPQSLAKQLLQILFQTLLDCVGVSQECPTAETWLAKEGLPSMKLWTMEGWAR